MQQCIAAVLSSFFFLFSQSRIFKHRKKKKKRSMGIGIWNETPSAKCQTAENASVLHCIGRRPTDRDASDTLGPISSKRLLPRVKQSQFWSARLHVQSHCEIAWAHNRKDAIFLFWTTKDHFFFLVSYILSAVLNVLVKCFHISSTSSLLLPGDFFFPQAQLSTEVSELLLASRMTLEMCSHSCHKCNEHYLECLMASLCLFSILTLN